MRVIKGTFWHIRLFLNLWALENVVARLFQIYEKGIRDSFVTKCYGDSEEIT